MQKQSLDLKKALGKQRLVLISNRGPVKFELNEKQQLVLSRSSGGLVTALNSILKTTGAVWIAAAMTETDRWLAKKQKLIGLPEKDPVFWLKFVDAEPKKFSLCYDHISNGLFWFLHHYLFPTLTKPTFDEEQEKAWQAYDYVNKQFAKTVAELTVNEKNPLIMIHDYHFYLLPGYLRSLKPEAAIFQFLHTPWCAPDYFLLLPRHVRQAILHSLLANDLIGMHSWRYVRNFLQCIYEFLSYKIDLKHNLVINKRRKIKVKAYPISISVSDLMFYSQAEEVLAYKKQLEKEKGDLKLIVRIDGVELSKNLVRGFDAYKLLLVQHPELK